MGGHVAVVGLSVQLAPWSRLMLWPLEHCTILQSSNWLIVTSPPVDAVEDYHVIHSVVITRRMGHALLLAIATLQGMAHAKTLLAVSPFRPVWCWAIMKSQPRLLH